MGFPHYCMFIIHHIQQKTIINTYVITINVFTTIFNHVVPNLSPFIMCAPTPWCRPAARAPRALRAAPVAGVGGAAGGVGRGAAVGGFHRGGNSQIHKWAILVLKPIVFWAPGL